MYWESYLGGMGYDGLPIFLIWITQDTLQDPENESETQNTEKHMEISDEEDHSDLGGERITDPEYVCNEKMTWMAQNMIFD